MAILEVTSDVYSVGSQDWNRTLFDAFIGLPKGTSYNAHLIRGSEKTALLNAIDPDKEEELITHLIRLKVSHIDYIVALHTEQDHSGAIPMLLELFPSAVVVCTESGMDLLGRHLGVDPQRCKVISDNETLSLGNKTLQFMITPWVHWPDSMLAYCPEDKILFSCDLFGSHYATSDLFVTDFAEEKVLAKRYFAEIMMPFRSSIVEYLKRLEALEIDIIAPSHGPCVKPASFILDLYRVWTSDETENLVVIPYVSMHGSVKRMVHHLSDVLVEQGVAVQLFDLTTADTGDIAASLVDARTLILGVPTMLFGPHPLAASVAFVANMVRPKTKYLGIIGSYGWGGRTVEVLLELTAMMQAERLEPVYIQGAPDGETYDALDALAQVIIEKHHEN
ncbi:MAG: FprA family A-type flavoprotein [Methanomicrobiales archaeon]|jgi:flavorubredoxin|nr:FprA family A-type flavoprotein [Methanomicrobiales archaeon]